MPKEVFKATVRFEGLRELRALAKEDATVGEPLRASLEDIGDLFEREGRKAAPREKGTAAASIKSYVSRKAVPTYVAIRVKARNRGFRYPYALDAGVRRPYHYAGTGQPTRGWFSSLREKLAGQVNRLLQDAAKRVEARWRT